MLEDDIMSFVARRLLPSNGLLLCTFFIFNTLAVSLCEHIDALYLEFRYTQRIDTLLHILCNTVHNCTTIYNRGYMIGLH